MAFVQYFLYVRNEHTCRSQEQERFHFNVEKNDSRNRQWQTYSSFPEGTISPRAPALIEFKSGAFSLAVSKKIPIVPVTFVTNWKRLQRKKFWLGKAGPGFADVVVHQPVYTHNLTKHDIKSLAKQVQTIINEPLYKRWGCTLD